MSLRLGVLAMGRALTEEGFTETVTVTSKPVVVTDPVTLDDVETSEERYSGPGQIKYPSATVSDTSAASQSIASQAPILKLPVGTTADIRTDDIVTITTSEADDSLAGRKFRVSGRPASGQVTSHRYPLEEIS